MKKHIYRNILPEAPAFADRASRVKLTNRKRGSVVLWGSSCEVTSLALLLIHPLSVLEPSMASPHTPTTNFILGLKALSYHSLSFLLGFSLLPSKQHPPPNPGKDSALLPSCRWCSSYLLMGRTQKTP